MHFPTPSSPMSPVSSNQITFHINSLLGPPDKKPNHLSSGVTSDRIYYASCSMRGYRPSLEDEILVETNCKTKTQCYAVFDGHAGPNCAKFLRANWNQMSRECDLKSDTSIEEMFLKLDAEFEKRQNERFRNNIPEELDCGSTACSLYISKADDNTLDLVCCNVGDSRCVLFNGDYIEALSYDHKPGNLAELERIEAAGGYVLENRVNGTLAVSRCFGDYMFKKTTDRRRSAVTALPDISRSRIVLKPDTIQFAVIACDGLFDVMDNDTVVQYIGSRLQQQMNMRKVPDPMSIVKDLLSRAIRMNSTDNVSAIIIAFR